MGGALILKELFDLSDDEVVETLLPDPRYQYALHTTSYNEQPISDKTLTRFRQRCYDYERLHDIDLYYDCVTDIAAKSAKLMGIDGRIRRMDSLMIEATIRKVSRMELIYRCISKLVVYLHTNKFDHLIKDMEHYYDVRRAERYARIFRFPKHVLRVRPKFEYEKDSCADDPNDLEKLMYPLPGQLFPLFIHTFPRVFTIISPPDKLNRVMLILPHLQPIYKNFSIPMSFRSYYFCHSEAFSRGIFPAPKEVPRPNASE